MYFNLVYVFSVTGNTNKAKCIFTRRGRYEYDGTQSTTCSGRKCVAWGKADEFFIYHLEKKDFPLDLDSDISELKYCRNPELQAMGDGCFTKDGYDSCCIPPCAGETRKYISNDEEIIYILE